MGDLTESAKKPRNPDELLSWHSRHQEQAIEPDLPIIDAHHHNWVRKPYKYLLEELVADTNSGHNIRATVFVECTAMFRKEGPPNMAPVGETEFVNGLAAMSASGLFGDTRACAAIVGFADLRLGARVEDVLVAHMEAARGRFRGIRNRAQHEPSMDWAHQGEKDLLRGTDFRAGFAKLAPLGLTYDSWGFFNQLDDVCDLADLFPTTTIILNHLGGILGIAAHEGRKEEVFRIWKERLFKLAKRPNVVVKVGGLGMPMCGFGFAMLADPASSEKLAEAWRPYIETGIEAFGPARAMFESNFPVDSQSCSYGSLWNAFKLVTRGMSASERHALFFGTAKRIYRLEGISA